MAKWVSKQRVRSVTVKFGQGQRKREKEAKKWRELKLSFNQGRRHCSAANRDWHVQRAVPGQEWQPGRGAAPPNGPGAPSATNSAATKGQSAKELCGGKLRGQDWQACAGFAECAVCAQERVTLSPNLAQGHLLSSLHNRLIILVFRIF